MRLKEYITEYVSSGRNRSNSEQNRHLTTEENLESMCRWLEAFGVRRIGSYTSNDFNIVLDKKSGPVFTSDPVFWGGYHETYKRDVVRLYIPHKDKIYQFEIFFGRDKGKIERIWAYDRLFAIMVRDTNQEKLDFIKKCLS